MVNKLGSAFVLVLCASFPAWASSAPGGQQESSNRQITLNVVVSGKNREPVSGLEKQDFTILDNQRPESITSFAEISDSQPKSPVQAIVVLDTVNTSFQTLAAQRSQLEKFFLQTGGQLPLRVMLEIFSDSGLTKQPEASTNGHAAIDFLNQHPIAVHQDNRAQGEAGAFDRINRSLAALQEIALNNLKVPGPKLLIWISPGWPVPQESALGLSSKEKQAVFNRIVAVTGLLLVSRTTLYSVDPLGTADAGGFATSRYRYYLNEIKSPTQPQVANLALQVFAIHSGGQVFVGSNDISDELNDCLEDASAIYTISFDPPPSDHVNEYHHVEIKIDKPGVKARTRSSFYLQP